MNGAERELRSELRSNNRPPRIVGWAKFRSDGAVPESDLDPRAQGAIMGYVDRFAPLNTALLFAPF